MSISVRLRQYSFRVFRLSLRPWVAVFATLSVIFYLAIFNAATISVTSSRDALELQAAGLNISETHHVHPTDRQKLHPSSSSSSSSSSASSSPPKLLPNKDDQKQQPQAPPPKKVDGAYAAFLKNTPVINNHAYSYVHNVPHACAERNATLVIVSPSGPGNFYRRMMARNSARAKYVADPSNHAVQLFFLGSSRNPTIQHKIAAESRKFGDVVQESFVDVYRNITFKAVEMLKWVSVFCNASENVIRLDDDVMADIPALLESMRRTRLTHSEFILGEVKRGWPPCQIPKCKTTKEEYPYATLPPFALGGALGYPTSSVIRLYEATRRLKRFKLDDVYVTGMCAPKVGVKLLEDKEFAFKHGAW